MTDFELKTEIAYNELQRDIADAKQEIWCASSEWWLRRKYWLHMLCLKTALIAAFFRRCTWRCDYALSDEWDANQTYQGLYGRPLNGWGKRCALPRS